MLGLADLVGYVSVASQHETEFSGLATQLKALLFRWRFRDFRQTTWCVSRQNANEILDQKVPRGRKWFAFGLNSGCLRTKYLGPAGRSSNRGRTGTHAVSRNINHRGWFPFGSASIDKSDGIATDICVSVCAVSHASWIGLGPSSDPRGVETGAVVAEIGL